jgi:rare lipoprotein A (peptidoglycan hydrolase)
VKLVRALAAPLGLAAAVSLTGCFTAPTQRAGSISSTDIPPGTAPLPAPPVPQAVPDAVPRVEPRSRYGNPPFYDVFGKRYYVLSSSVGYVERGVASWYGPGFHKVRTSTGELYDMYGMTAAHKTLPLPAYVRVTNLQNGHSVVVRVNDRGPFVGNRIIDLSYTAAAKLDMLRNGTAMVEVRAIDPQVPMRDQSAPLLAVGPMAPASGQAGAATGNVPPAGVSTASLATASDVSAGAVTVNAPAAGATPVSAAATSASNGAAGGTAPASTASVGVAPGIAPIIVGVAQTGTAAGAARPASGAVPAATARTTLFVQAGAFADPANAERLAGKLRGGGYGNIFVRDDLIAGRKMYRVRIGPVPDVPEFDRIVAALERAGVHDAHLALD